MRFVVLAVVAMGTVVGQAQGPAPRDFRIVRLDPALDAIVCATNVAFGDADAKGLYITACNRLFRVRLNAPGIRPGPMS